MERILFPTHSTYSQRAWVSYGASDKRDHVCITERDCSGMFLAMHRGGGGGESTGKQGLPGNLRVILSINPPFLDPNESSFIHSRVLFTVFLMQKNGWSFMMRLT